MTTPLSPTRRVQAMSMPEDRGPGSLEAHLKQLMDHYGLWGFHVRNSVGSARGWPDWVILGPGGALFRELKTERNGLSVDQRAVGAKLTRAGLNWAVWRPADLLNGVIARQLAAIAAPPREAM